MPIKEDNKDERPHLENASGSSSHDSSVEKTHKEKAPVNEGQGEEKSKNKLFIKNLINDKVLSNLN